MTVMGRIIFTAVISMAAVPAIFSCQPAQPVNIKSFTVTPASITEGGSATLSWDVSGVAQAAIDNSIGSVPASGSLAVNPAATTVYTLSAGSGKSFTSKSVTVQVTRAVAPPVQPAEETPVTLSARDTQQLIKAIGSKARVEGDVTYISSWIPARSADNFVWVFIFFMENPWEGSSSDPGLGCDECWRDFTSFFRLIIKPANIHKFGYYTQNRPAINLNDHVVVSGRIDGYQSAPAIYLTDTSQVKVTGR